jgi:hypothetical protein
MEETEEPFFTKSKETFYTDTIEAWGRLRRHYTALVEFSRKDVDSHQYHRLWHYEKRVLEMIRELEKKPALMVVQEDENTLPLDTSASCQPIKYEGPCTMTKTTEEETIGTYLRSMRQSSQAASSSGE